MQIVSSVVTMDDPQADGRRWVKESHTDTTGAVHEYGPYMAAADLDVEAQLAVRAAAIEQMLNAPPEGLS